MTNQLIMTVKARGQYTEEDDGDYWTDIFELGELLCAKTRRANFIYFNKQKPDDIDISYHSIDVKIGNNIINQPYTIVNLKYSINDDSINRMKWDNRINGKLDIKPNNIKITDSAKYWKIVDIHTY
jgi:hypothetical protein